ncbi:CapA family protein [Microbacterium sp. NIBRBAC000506063]|nr:CapA family protein [Microbacterium sp. NIBRBAC000506063]QTV80571.1 CapA family protein [Microbacterium sp. NIBRBAC000506063]
MTAVIERFETREPSFPVRSERLAAETGVIPRSRFDSDGNVYRGGASAAGSARLMIVGDLMARFRQQAAASATPGFSFDFSFDHVRALFAEGDFVMGNLETAVSPSVPYTLEAEHINARPHLNSPISFLSALRRAGFDAVTNAQNHVYDAGTRGVLETLDAANQCQLLHTGHMPPRRTTDFLSSTSEESGSVSSPISTAPVR